jgi:Flp pilus assembly protein TadG
MQKRASHECRGAATVELAVLLTFIMFLFVIAVDYARVFYYSQIIENCARNGALYGSNLTTANSPYSTLQDAALADATGLSPQPTVSSTTGKDAAGNSYIRVTVDWQFQSITGFPGVPSTVDLRRTVQMRVAPN